MNTPFTVSMLADRLHHFILHYESEADSASRTDAMTSCNWQSWEYGQLGLNRDAEASASRLGRSPDEVREKINRYCNATFDEWYLRTRCPSAPESSRRLLGLARKFWRDEFARSIPGGDVENIVISVLKGNFRRFDPAKGDTNVPVETRFVRHFRHWLRKRLQTEASRNRGWPVRLLAEYPPDLHAVEEGDPSGREEHLAWCRHLLHLALPRLEPRTRRVFEMRFLRGMDAAEMSIEMGIAEKTISN